MPSPPDALLSFREALRSPCLSCRTSPCCTHLLLGTVPLTTLAQVDHALYLLNFDGIYMSPSRELDAARLYLHQACRHLDAEDGLCTIHSTPDQPAVCVSYKSQSCDYRWILGDGDDDTAVLVDHRRMSWLARNLLFDEQRRVVGRPPFEQVREAFRGLPLERQPLPPEAGWKPVAFVGSEGALPGADLYRFDDHQVSAPCTGCAAWCCQTLEFDRGLPGSVSHLDFLRYSLGFPSVELSISDGSWSLIVHTTCRHHSQGRCSVFGLPDRPLECSLYDELRCEYRIRFGAPDPSRVAISLQEFPSLVDLVVFDEYGRVVAVPSVDVIRERLIEREQGAYRALSADTTSEGR